MSPSLNAALRYSRLMGRFRSASPSLLLGAVAHGVADGVALARSGRGRVVSQGPQTGDAALVSGPIAPFLSSARTAVPSHWAWRTLAEVLLERGYRLDVVSHLNTAFVPQRPYSLFVGAREDFVRLAELLPGSCLKVLHLDSADVLFQNLAELERLGAIKDRRGAVLTPRRYVEPTPALQHADSAIVHGSDWTLETYRYARIPLHRVPTVSLGEHASPESRDFQACRRQFLWLGGRGLAHQGLDRVLEAFAGTEALGLTVCGRLAEEPDFTAAYARELRGVPGITTAGWIDVTGRRFAEIARRSVALVFPSCAEGQSGEAVAAMAAGVIPIVSRESGVDVGDAGVVLDDCSVETIVETVRRIAGLPAERLREMAMQAWETARAHHGPSIVAERYRSAIGRIVEARTPVS
jgi:hypothetical protein